MSKDEPGRVGKTGRELPERMQGQPMPQPERLTIHYTELPEDTQVRLRTSGTSTAGKRADSWRRGMRANGC
jgi:hypothetical protein